MYAWCIITGPVLGESEEPHHYLLLGPALLRILAHEIVHAQRCRGTVESEQGGTGYTIGKISGLDTMGSRKKRFFI